jgi:hypothetical protein
MPSEKDPAGMPAEVLELMHRIGYMHETEIQTASSTTPRTRARWKSPRRVMFGNEPWYPLDEVKRHLDARAAGVDDDDDRRPAAL